MSFKRQSLPSRWKSGEELTGDLNGIGFRFSGSINSNPLIEDTLMAASIEGIIGRDGRVMSLLTDWISIHFRRINVDRLFTIIKSLESLEYEAVKIYWCANAQRLSEDSRFEKLRSIYKGRRRDYLALLEKETNEAGSGSGFLIRKNGEDERFKNTCIQVPNLVLRHRPKDILTPQDLAKHHSGYRFRIMLGPTYRADVWALLRKYPELSVTKLATRAYCAYNTAKNAKDDYELVKRDYSDRKRA